MPFWLPPELLMRIRIRVTRWQAGSGSALESKGSNWSLEELWTLTLKPWKLKMESWKVCRPVVAALHHFDVSKICIRIKVKSRFWIRIKVLRILNPGYHHSCVQVQPCPGGPIFVSGWDTAHRYREYPWPPLCISVLMPSVLTVTWVRLRITNSENWL